jgi:hypothetical protein
MPARLPLRPQRGRARRIILSVLEVLGTVGGGVGVEVARNAANFDARRLPDTAARPAPPRGRAQDSSWPATKLARGAPSFTPRTRAPPWRKHRLAMWRLGLMRAGMGAFPRTTANENAMWVRYGSNPYPRSFALERIVRRVLIKGRGWYAASEEAGHRKPTPLGVGDFTVFTH